MPAKLLLLTILAWALNSSFAIGYAFSFKQLSYEQGLPGTNVRAFFQDSDGIMWIGVESYGLTRYDGHKFLTYQNNPNNPNSLSNNHINKITEDSLGFFWIATEHGLNRFDKKREQFEVFLHNSANNQSIPDNYCHTVFIDSDHILWIGTSNGIGILERQSMSFTHMLSSYTTSLQSESIIVSSIIEYPKGIIWAGTSKGLLRIDKQTGQYKLTDHYRDGQNKRKFQIKALLAIDQQIWIGSNIGLLKYNVNDEEITPFHLLVSDERYLRDEGFGSLICDPNGLIWAGSFTKGILVIDPITNEYQHIKQSDQTENPLKSNNIRSMYVDRMGLVWIGTKFKGIFRYNSKERYFTDWPKEFNFLESLSDKYILAVFDDRNGTIWLGTKHDGLYKAELPSKKVTQYSHLPDKDNALSSSRINHVFRDSRNQLWVGTEKGLFQLNEHGIFQNYGAFSVNWITEDKTGIVWLGTTSGVFIVDPTNKNTKRFDHQNPHHLFSTHEYNIVHIYEDQNGLLWFVSKNKGVYTYSHTTNECKLFDGNQNKTSLPEEYMIRTVFHDSNGRIWLGTKTRGLLLLDQHSNIIRSFTTNNGLPSDMILNIEEDTSGMLWLGTFNGISLFDPTTHKTTNFNSDHGIKSNISEKGASAKLHNGFLLFGGNNGFNIFDPYEISVDQGTSPIIITSVRINNIEKQNYITTITDITLDHRNTLLSIEFTMPDYNNPFRHQYSVLLSGIDDSWREIGNRNDVTYNNLPSGEYQFKVKAVNEYGNLSDEIILLNINVMKPYYETLWFRTSFIMAIILLVGFTYFQLKKRQKTLELLINERTRKLEVAYKELLNKNTRIREQNRQIEQHHQELEKKVAERTLDLEVAKRKAEESDRLKSSFLANMSHEVRTPLNAISGFSTLICSDIYGPERKQKYVNIIKTNVQSLLKLVEDILDISKIEAGQLTIEKEFFDFSNMIAELNATFQEEIKNLNGKSIKLQCENISPTDSLIEFYSDQHRIRQIMVNLLSNAIKFTKIGKIAFGYKLNEGSITLWVSDTGIGIKKNDLDSIFDRFTKIEEGNAIYRGTGLGLSISKSLVNLLGGRIWVESEVNIGSTFYFEIPGEIKVVRNWHSDSVEPTKTTKLNLTNKTVLIIEPERSSYMLMHSYLLPTHAKITWAHNAASAIDFCKQKKYDIIIQELRLPDIDGYLLYKELVKILPNTIIIAQTAYATPEEKKKMTTWGFKNFIIKPYLKNELINTIAKVYTPL